MRVLFPILPISLALPLLLSAAPVLAETVGITNQPIYVTEHDCHALVQHRPSPGVTYQPGVDAKGHYVAPADLPGSNYAGLVPTNGARFTVQVNPMNYAKGSQGGSVGTTATQGRYANTALPVGQVEVDLHTGAATLNGKPLTGQQEQIVAEACRKAGIR